MRAVLAVMLAAALAPGLPAPLVGEECPTAPPGPPHVPRGPYPAERSSPLSQSLDETQAALARAKAKRDRKNRLRLGART